MVPIDTDVPSDAHLDTGEVPAIDAGHPEEAPAPRRSRRGGSRSRKPSRRPDASGPDAGRRVLRSLPRRPTVDVAGGTTLTLLVLGAHEEDTTAIDLSSGSLVRARIPWPEDHPPDLATFDVVEAVLAPEPERDDLAQPEALTLAGLPRHLGTLKGRVVRPMLKRLTTPVEDHVLGFPGASAPYWEFRGFRPSVAIVTPSKGPMIFRREARSSTWVRFGWGRTDNWMPLEDPNARRALDVARRDRLAGKDLATALGFKPHYLLVSLSSPRNGHCYKTVRAVLPRG